VPTIEPSVVTMKLNVDPEDVKKVMAAEGMTFMPKEKKGRWKVWYHGRQGDGLYAFSYSCSECGFHGDGTNYCPNCGAKMDGGEEDGRM